jgi:hypothetical protein
MARERKPRAMDGVGDRAVAEMGQKLKELWHQGVAEASNALYPGSNIAIPVVLSQSQLQHERPDPMKEYEESLAAASQKAHEQPKQTEMER